MKTNLQFKIASIIVMLLGVIHTAATPMIFPVFKPHSQIDFTSVYMFVIVGIATILLGWLQWFTSKRVSENPGFKKILRLSIVFLLIIGAGAVSTLPDNPFAYISLAVAVYECVLFSQLSRG